MSNLASHLRNQIKKKILKEQLIPYRCQLCTLSDTWNEKPLSLQLDHINGDPLDNQIENLRFLCPNCHSQTDTFGGRKNRKDNRCLCGKQIKNHSLRCKACSAKDRYNKNTKINWPELSILLKIVEETSYLEVARQLGVSDNAIRHHIRRRT